MKKVIFCCLFQLISVSFSYAGLLGPSNYEDCVLENLKNAKTDLAVQTVYAMCSEKFQSKPSKKGQNEIPQQCLLFWNGLKTTVLSKEPNDWKKNYSQYQVSRYGMSVGLVFVPKGIEFNKDTELLIYKQVEIYCQ